LRYVGFFDKECLCKADRSMLTIYQWQLFAMPVNSALAFTFCLSPGRF
jgi:hypothetical protein